ncbi:MAG: GNAT family N-acetyltransferase [Chitinophagales bacterium]
MLPENMKITVSQSAEDIHQILSLQQKNLPKNISKSEADEQGFVTVEHDFEILYSMHLAEPAVITKDGNTLAGYALVMTKEFGKKIPVLVPMFELFETIVYQNKKLSEYTYFVMGQVCIDKPYRGLGLFDKMYAELKENLKGKYELMITEVATSNQRSVNAHKRAGLETIFIYTDDGGEEWQIMTLEL